MQHPIRSFAVGALALTGTLGLAASPAAAKPKEWFQYSVSFTCGENQGDALRVVKGEFATAVNLFNAGNASITLHKSLALTYPPAEQAAGEVSDPVEDVLSPGTALQIDCEEIANEFVFATPPAATDHLQGFVVIESNLPLNVEAVYTAAGANGDVSVDVERVAERLAVPRPFVRPTKVAICHVPPGNPDAAHTILVDAAAVPAHKAHGDTLGPCPRVE
jgi:hypothetical protein